MAGPEITPELLAQLERDAAWFSPDENPYRLGIAGEMTIDGDEEDADEMTIYGEMDDGASHEVATFHVDNMAHRAVRLFGAAPALVAAAKERDQLHWKLDNTTALYTSHRNDAAAVAVALGLDGWEHGWPDVAPMIERMRAERDQLRAEVERLRGCGIEAIDLLNRAEVLDRGGAISDLRAEIERKP